MTLPQGDEPTHALEIERKYDAAVGHTPPDLSVIEGVASVDAVERRVLDAVYFDTDDLALAHRQVALRRRRGGPDAGWHVKTTAPEGRHEYGWPLDDGPDETWEIVVPPVVLAAVREWIGDSPVSPLARVRNDRDAYVLRDAAGGVVAEFTDDAVTADDLRRGAVTSWREWEFELGPAAPDDTAARDRLFDSVEAVVRAAGGRPSESGSKLQRALGR